MADLKFDTKGFQTRELQGIKELKVDTLNPNKEFRANRVYDPGGRKLGTPAAEVFTGTSTLGGETLMFSRASRLDGKRVEVTQRGPFGREMNPLGERTFPGANRRYEGPEIKRRTTELEIIKQALKAKESTEGRVLSMEEVRSILQSYE